VPRNLWIRVIFALSGLGLKTKKGDCPFKFIVNLINRVVFIKCVEHFKGRSIVKSYEELQNRAFLCLRYSNLAIPNDLMVCDNFSSKKNAQ
jgi:hypothetical protein